MSKLRTIAILPTLFTLGNLACGFFAIVVAARVERPTTDKIPEAAAIHASDGTEIGRISANENTERFDPPSVGKQLTGATIEILVPISWLFRRKLAPVANESVPFLDAFARHQIERITPWREADVPSGLIGLDA